MNSMNKITHFFCAAGFAALVTLGGGGSALAQDTAPSMDEPTPPASEGGAGWQ